jgi:Asp-tRNA(Asn)/Glu-tRNA(Gln) amidotransferase A subunit family amidase
VGDVASLLAGLGAQVDVPILARPPRIGTWRSVQWPRATPAMQARLEEVAAELRRAGASVRDVDLGPDEAELSEAQELVMAEEAVRSMQALRARAETSLGPHLTALLDRGSVVTREEARSARALADRARAATARLLTEVDVLLTPSAAGEAPEGLTSTGDPVFNRVVTLLGFPCIGLPAGTGPAGLPLGVQLVGAPRGEGSLLAVAEWVESRLGRSRGH